MRERDDYTTCSHLGIIVSLLTVCLRLTVAPSFGQMPPDEHAAHHGGQGQTGAVAPPASPGPQTGMGQGMGEMMREMGVPPAKEFYPSLMALPTDLSSEKRTAIQQQAYERMTAGAALLSEGVDALSKSLAAEDVAAMQDATVRMRQGFAQLESGLAARSALAAGRSPRHIALEWFKREMNLLPPDPSELRHGLFGVPRFHVFVLAILLSFTVAVSWMYVQKMRRAATLLERLSAMSAPPGPDSQANSAAPTPETPPAVTTPSTETVRGAVPRTPATSRSFEVRPVPPNAQTSPVIISPGAPILPPKRSGPLRVARIFQETPEVKTFRFVNADGAPIPFAYLPGQFLVLTVVPDGKRVKRSYTIASTPTQRYYCEITVKHEESGLVSGYLHDQVHEGDMVEITAPSGYFTFTGHEADSIVLIGGGVGITPLMSVIRYLTDSGWNKDIFFLYCCRTSRDFIFREELEFLQRRHANLHVVATMTRAEGTTWMGPTGHFTRDLFAQSVPNLVSRRIHVCGPPPMMEAVMQMLSELGVPAGQIKTEAFGPAQRPAAKRAVAAGCTCERCERRRREMAVGAVATTPAPAAEATRSPVPVVTAPTTAAPAAAAAIVTYQVSGKSAPLPPDETVLDVADEIGVEIDNSCRVGICGTCRVKLLSGAVTMEVEDGLDPEDKAQNIVLACQAKSTSDVVVEA